MSKFDNINIGDKAEIKHLITQNDIDKFVQLTGDDNRIHIDANYASKTSFKKPIAHGMLGASFISTLIGTKLPGDGALWFAQNLEFLLPVRVGDEISIKAEILNKIAHDKIVEMKTDIFNQHGQKVTTGTAKIKIIEQQADRPDNEEKKQNNRIALVIGGSGGIGKAACLQLAKDGFSIAVHCNKNTDTAMQIQKDVEKLGQKSVVVKADITDQLQVSDMLDAVVRRLGTVTVLVNCSTIKIPSKSFLSLKWADMQSHLDINIKGAFHLMQAVVPLMEKEGYGKIIHITSQAVETPNSQWVHYITAKAGLAAFSKALAVELGPKGIRVNIISPSMTDTELIADIPEKAKLLAAAKSPLKRIATVDDVAGAISFLASSKSDFLTGETIRVNGGQVML
jgi:3-oxoacyl-[acyl-carrier protein] reductase